MYTEEPRKEINWGNLIKKGLLILFIAILIFLVIWLFTRNSSNSVNVDYEGNKITENNKNLNSDTYSEIFINNYRYFHDTAKEYFLISNLPEKSNTLKFTLQELIDKKLILPFSYTSTESCDTEASYVSVKNDNGKYTMTTTLVCGKEAATTKEELGCNQLCSANSNCSCDCDKVNNEEKVLEYEYKQAYSAKENVYTCPTGYTKTGSGSNTKCIKTDSTTISPIKKVQYTCKKGYTMVGSGSTAICTKGTEKTIDATKTTIYSCPSGYREVGSGSNTKCYKYTEDKIKADYTYKYTCDNGYVLSGSQCYKQIEKIIDATKDTTYTCSSGYTLNGTKCTKTVTTTDTKNATATTKYSCSKGELVNTKYCRIYSDYSYYKTYPTYKGKTYNGCTYSGAVNNPCTGNNCTKTEYKYYCSGKSYKDVDATAKTTYSCSKYSDYDLSGTKCIKTITSTDTKDATKDITYTCPSGYSLNGTSCIKTSSTSINADKEKVYYCSDDSYVLDSKYCYKLSKEYISATKTTTYTCDKGYTKVGSGSNTKCVISNKESTKVLTSTTYTCENGYTKIGVGSTAVCTKGTTTSVKPSVTTKTVTKYKYKWSKNETLTGWERTGKTRYVTASSK